jgi:hypothetical protein
MHQSPGSARSRSTGSIVRVTTSEARISFVRWCGGAATVTVSALPLRQALGLERDRLLGARVSAVIDTAARFDDDVRPEAWYLIDTTASEPPASTASTSSDITNAGGVRRSGASD